MIEGDLPGNAVAASGGPPCSGTRKSPLPPVPNRIVPFGLQDPPRPSTPSQIVWIDPLVSSTFFNWPSVKNPIQALSGDQNG